MERFEPKAKINVALRVVGRREDGYHDVEMVNLPLAMSDTLEVGLAKGKEDILSVSDDRLSDPSKNLVTKAFRTFREKTGSKLYFHAVLQKRIPVEAGLGGGSSDCASALIAAHRLAGIDDPEGIRELALSLGADVPYFLNPVPAYVTGRIVPICPKSEETEIVPECFVCPDEIVLDINCSKSLITYVGWSR